MRERLAVGISILAMSVLIGLSVLFAMRQNPDTAGWSLAGTAPGDHAGELVEADVPPPDPGAVTQANDSLAGLGVFRASGCERCHSVAGVGSPRYPLDGVGSRRTEDALFAWTVGSEAVQDSLSPSALRAKQRYLQLPAAEMRVLLAYMARLIDR
jgi:hypothetical protein